MKIEPAINRSEQFGNLKFSTRKDYTNYFLQKGLVKNEAEIWDNEKYVSLIHRHWHGEGRNGCIFALLASRRADELGWKDFVLSKTVDELEKSNTLSLIESTIESAILDPNCQVLSLLFSKITNDEQLVRLIVYLLRGQSIILVDESEYKKLVTLSLRVELQNKEVLSWLMAFGPFSYFPETRQSPVTEIAIRVKIKPDVQFHRLNKDKDAAHLADLPIDYKEEVMETTWQNTLRRTRIILGSEPNQFSAAKTTFSIPKNIWFSFR